MAAYFTLYSQNDEYVRFRLYLSDSFNQDYYNSAGITRYKFTSTSGASSISGIVGEENAPSSGTSSRVSVDVYYDDLPADPGDTITLYAYAEDTSGRYWAIENEDGDFGIEIEIPKPVEPSIYSFDTSSVDVGQREITFDYDIRDWNSNVYGVLLIRTTEESTAGEYNVGYLDSSGSFSYTTSRYDSFYASLRITDGRGGDYIAEESCDTRPIDVIPSFSNFRYGSYSGEKSAYFRWNMDDITSDCYYLVYSRLQGESSYGSERLDYSATSHTFFFSELVLSKHISFYITQIAEEKLHVTRVVEMCCQNPLLQIRLFLDFEQPLTRAKCLLLFIGLLQIFKVGIIFAYGLNTLLTADMGIKISLHLQLRMNILLLAQEHIMLILFCMTAVGKNYPAVLAAGIFQSNLPIQLQTLIGQVQN